MAADQEKPADAEKKEEKAQASQPSKPAPVSGKPGETKGKNGKGDKKPPSKFGLLMRRLLRGALLALFLFAAGMAVTYFFLQQPRVRALNAEVEELQAENVQLQDQVLGLQAEVNDLTPLADENTDLAADLGDARLHIQILSVLKDVQAARIAVAEEQFADARVALTRTGEKLDELRELLPPANRAVVDGMAQRLELTLDGLDGDAVAPASDLSVLANSLIQLENSLFTEP